MKDSRIFKSPNNIYYTKQLFYETADTDRTLVLYTLKDDDWEGYPSLRRLYLELDDETEYRVASELFGGWPHWQKLLNCNWFLEYLNEWREELKVKHASLSLSILLMKGAAGDVKVNQYLLDRTLKEKNAVGRPTKKRIREEAQMIVQAQDDIKEDLKRLLQ